MTHMYTTCERYIHHRMFVMFTYKIRDIIGAFRDTIPDNTLLFQLCELNFVFVLRQSKQGQCHHIRNIKLGYAINVLPCTAFYLHECVQFNDLYSSGTLARVG